MYRYLICFVAISLLFGGCKKEEDDSTKNLLTLVVLQQAQASATESAKQAAIAAKPGCKSLVEITATGEANKVSLSARSSTNGEIAIKFTIQSGQKLVFTGTNLSDNFGSIYKSDACTSGDFSRTGNTYNSTGNSTRQTITYTNPGSFIQYYGTDGVSSTNESVHIE